MSRSQSRAGVSSSSSSSLLTALNRAVPRFMSRAKPVEVSPLLCLPTELLYEIISYLVQNASDFYAFKCACTILNEICESFLSQYPALAFRIKPARLHPLSSPSGQVAYLVEYASGRLDSILQQDRSPDGAARRENYSVISKSNVALQTMFARTNEYNEYLDGEVYVLFVSANTLWCYDRTFNLCHTYSFEAKGEWKQGGYDGQAIFHLPYNGGVEVILPPKANLDDSYRYGSVDRKDYIINDRTEWRHTSIKFPAGISLPVITDCFVLRNGDCLIVSKAGHVYRASLHDLEISATPLLNSAGDQVVASDYLLSRERDYSLYNDNWLCATESGELYYYDSTPFISQRKNQLVKVECQFRRMIHPSFQKHASPVLFENSEGEVCALVILEDNPRTMRNFGTRFRVFHFRFNANLLDRFIILPKYVPSSLMTTRKLSTGCDIYFFMKDGSLSKSSFSFFQGDNSVGVNSPFFNSLGRNEFLTKSPGTNMFAVVSSFSDALFMKKGRIFCSGSSVEGLFGSCCISEITHFVYSRIAQGERIIRIGVYGRDFLLVTSRNIYYVLSGAREAQPKDYLKTEYLRLEKLFDVASVGSAEVRTLELVDPYAKADTQASTTHVASQAAIFSPAGVGKEEEDEWLQSSSSLSQSIEAAEEEDAQSQRSVQLLKPAGRAMDYSEWSSRTFRSPVPVHSQQGSDSYSELQIGEDEVLVSRMDRDAQSEQLAWYEVLCCRSSGHRSR